MFRMFSNGVEQPVPVSFHASTKERIVSLCHSGGNVPETLARCQCNDFLNKQVGGRKAVLEEGEVAWTWVGDNVGD